MNWQDGSAPAAGGDPAQIIRFTYPGSSALTFTNDLTGTYVLNQLQLDLTAASAPTLAGNALQFGGAAPVLGLNGTAGATISENIVLNPGSGSVTITGSGSGGVTLSGVISETGGARSLVIAATPSSSNVQNITLSNQNTFTGGVRLQSGNLVLNTPSFNAIGTGVLTAAGGTLKFANSSSLFNNVSLEQRLVIGTTLPFAFATFISGTISSAVAGTGIDMRMDGSSLNLGSAATYSGSTTVDKSTVAAQAANAAGTLQLISAVNSPSFTISSGGTLSLATSSTLNRIGDTAQIILRGGQFAYAGSGTPGAAQVETVGAVSGAGAATVTVTNTSNVSVRVAASSLARVERGTFNFSGSKLGSTFGGAVGNILFATAPSGLTGGGGTGQSTSILPYATAADLTTGLTGLATYSAATGIRKLDESTEYFASFGGTSATSNLLITAGLPNNLPRTINSLSITGGSLTGTGAVTLAGGTVLANATGTATIANDLLFGSQEGFIHAFSPLVITGAVSGSNGLTIGGNSNGSVELTASNSITGPITINAGQLIFSSATAIGGDTSPIIIGNQNFGFQYKGAAALTMPRPVETHTGVAFLQNAGGDLTLGAVSGNGGLRFGGAGRFILSAGSTYTGVTAFGTATVQLGADSALGNGGAVDLGGGTVQLSGNWTTARELSLSAASTLDTAGFTATWSGELLSGFRLSKAGAGELVVTGHPNFTGPVTVASGAVRLADGGVLRTASYTVNAGAEIVIDNSGLTSADRLNNGAVVTLNGGGLRQIGNAVAATSETIGSLNGSSGIVTLAPAGSFGAALHVANVSSFPSLLLRGATLGGAAGTGYSRVVGDTNAPTFLSLQLRVIADSSLTGTGEFFAYYDPTSDAAGVIGYRPMRASEYASGASIQNAANGGTTPTGNFVATGDLTAVGAFNSVATVTLPGNLTLAAGQTLTITGSGVLARAAAAPTAISGGTLAFTAFGVAGTLYNAGEVTLTSRITGTSGFAKTGAGQLNFEGTAAYTGGTSVVAGTVRAGASDPLAAQVVDISAGAALTFVASSTAKVGGLSGAGNVVAPASLTVGGAGADFNFTGTLVGNVDLALIDGGNAAGVHRFGGASPFTGTVTLNGGELAFGSAAPFGTTPIVVNGGALAGVSVSATPALQLHTDLVVVGTTALTLASGTTISGAYDVMLRGNGGLTLQFPLTQTGRLRTLYGPDYHFTPLTPAPGTITVSGAQGSVLQASSVELTGGGLKLDNTTAFTGGAAGRLGDGIPLQLNGAALTLVGNSTTAVTESVGAISGSGYSTLAMTPNSANTTVLLPSALSRSERGAFLFSATTGVLGTTATTNAGKIKLPSAPAMIGGGGTLTAISIVPWAITALGSTYGAATYDADGFRPLAANEYVTSLTGAPATANVQINGASNNATLTINSLTITRIIVSPDLTGTGKLTITSGVVLYNNTSISSATLIQNALDFGAAEGQFFLPASGTPLQVDGVVSGSGGLTKSGPGPLSLTAQNTFTGPLTVNGGGLSFSNPAGLGPDTSTITLNGIDSYLAWTGAGASTLTRPIRLAGGVAGVSTGSNSSLTVNSLLSGPGGAFLTGTVTLSAGNTYQGLTYVGGTLIIPDDTALGTGTGLLFGSSIVTPTLRLTGDWTTSRRLEFQQSPPTGYSSIDTNGHDATLNGELAKGSTSSLRKDGAGTLTLTTANGFTRAVQVTGGAFRLSGAGALASTSVIVNGGTFLLDNTTMPGVNRLDDNSAVTLSAALTVIGNATTPVSETIKTLTVSGVGTLTLTAPGNASTTLNTTTVAKSGTGVLFVKGDQLGGGPTGSFTRLAAGVLPANLTVFASTGGPYGVATYDAGADAAGPIGYRLLRPAEFTTDAEIRNPANGGATPLSANMRISDTATVGGSAATVSSLTLAGASTLSLATGQTLTLQTNAVVAEPGASATIAGGSLTFPSDGAFVHTEGDLTLRSTVTNSTIRKSGPGQLFFETPYAGALTLLGGTVHVGASDPLGKAALTVNAGATLDFDNRPANLASLNSAGAVLLHGSTLRTTGALTVTGGDLSGTGGLEARAAVSLQAPIANTGPLTVIGNGGTSPRITLLLTGNGTALGASGLTGLAVSEVYLDNTNTVLSRVGAIPVALNGSNLTVAGSLSTPLAQDFGALSATGAVTLTANVATTSSQARQAVTVRFSNLIRNDHATLLVYGGADFSGSTSPAVGEGKATITLGTGLTSALVGANTTATNHPVLPFAYAHPTAGYNLVTYDPVNGIRGLRADEFSPALTAGDNVWLTTSLVNNADFSINSLKTDGYITGTGTLSVASGLVMSSSSSPSIQNNLSFGAAEAVFLTTSALSMSGAISGTGGLTKGGAGSLNLTGANTFTGPLTVNEGLLNFKDMGSLGADTSEIVLNDGASLVPNTANVTLTRGLRLNGFAQASISGPSTSGSLFIGAPITGTGQLLVNFSSVVFTTANTFAGNLTVGGTLTFGGDAMLGGGTQVALSAGGKFVLAAPWTTSRTLAVNGSSSATVDTAGYDASIAKLTSQFSFSSLVKSGAGLLTVSDASGFFGAMSVTAGEVRLNGTIPDNSTGTLSVSAGATLSGSLQGTRTVLVFGTLAPGDGVGTMSSGSLNFQSNATLAMELASATSYDQVNVTGSVTLTGTVQLALSLGVQPLVDTFTLILNDGTDAVSGRFTYAGSTLNEGSHFQVNGQELVISYVGGTGNDVVLAPVPEPASAALLILGGVAMATRRRRR